MKKLICKNLSIQSKRAYKRQVAFQLRWAVAIFLPVLCMTGCKDDRTNSFQKPDESTDYSVSTALNAIQKSSQKLPVSTREAIRENDYLNSILRPAITGECVRCFDKNDIRNGPREFYYAATVRFYEQKFEEGYEYLDWAAQQGHPSAINQIVLNYSKKGGHIEQDFRYAYLYTKLQAIQAAQFDLKYLQEKREKAVALLKVQVSDEDLIWVDTEIKKYDTTLKKYHDN